MRLLFLVAICTLSTSASTPTTSNEVDCNLIHSADERERCFKIKQSVPNMWVGYEMCGQGYCPMFTCRNELCVLVRDGQFIVRSPSLPTYPQEDRPTYPEYMTPTEPEDIPLEPEDIPTEPEDITPLEPEDIPTDPEDNTPIDQQPTTAPPHTTPKIPVDAVPNNCFKYSDGRNNHIICPGKVSTNQTVHRSQGSGNKVASNVLLKNLANETRNIIDNPTVVNSTNVNTVNVGSRNSKKVYVTNVNKMKDNDKLIRSTPGSSNINIKDVTARRGRTIAQKSKPTGWNIKIEDYQQAEKDLSNTVDNRGRKRRGGRRKHQQSQECVSLPYFPFRKCHNIADNQDHSMLEEPYFTHHTRYGGYNYADTQGQF